METLKNNKPIEKDDDATERSDEFDYKKAEAEKEKRRRAIDEQYNIKNGDDYKAKSALMDLYLKYKDSETDGAIANVIAKLLQDEYGINIPNCPNQKAS